MQNVHTHICFKNHIHSGYNFHKKQRPSLLGLEFANQWTERPLLVPRVTLPVKCLEESGERSGKRESTTFLKCLKAYFIPVERNIQTEKHLIKQVNSGKCCDPRTSLHLPAGSPGCPATLTHP